MLTRLKALQAEQALMWPQMERLAVQCDRQRTMLAEVRDVVSEWERQTAGGGDRERAQREVVNAMAAALSGARPDRLSDGGLVPPVARDETPGGAITLTSCVGWRDEGDPSPTCWPDGCERLDREGDCPGFPEPETPGGAA